MLIKALCDYYDKVMDHNDIPPGYEEIGITHTIYLNEDGTIQSIADSREKTEIKNKKGKSKTIYKNKLIVLPKRANAPTIRSEVIEHRGEYIFGLKYSKGKLIPCENKKNSFKEINLEFIKNMTSQIVKAYREFIKNWNPEKEINNEKLKEIKENYNEASFEFQLYDATNNEDVLHENSEVKENWKCFWKSLISREAEEKRSEELWKKSWEDYLYSKNESLVFAQCAITGENKPIARIHKKIKGLTGGKSTGTLLVCFDKDTASFSSYGKQQAYNSNISFEAMGKYTTTLNDIIKRNKIVFGDNINVVFFAIGKEKTEKENFENTEEIFKNIFLADGETSKGTEDMLKSVIEKAKQDKLELKKYLSTEKNIDPETDFYIVGLKPNSSRIAVNFIYHKRIGDILFNIAKHQEDMKIKWYSLKKDYPISIKEIGSELNSSKTIIPNIIPKMFKSILYNLPYPELLLQNMVRKVKTDINKDKKKASEKICAGIIKACINRKARLLNKEELNMAINKESTNSAYLYGRLFAVFEKIQKKSSKVSLNRTIKNSYFSSACSMPSIVFSKIGQLSQHHIEKLEEGHRIYYEKLIGEIMNKLNECFPTRLSLEEQGRFIIGYYHQMQDFFKKKDEEDKQKQESKK